MQCLLHLNIVEERPNKVIEAELESAQVNIRKDIL